ncbi:hypothetical protein [Streptomyces sp. NPDC020983]|uniref:hypothetical protein n=1 Tax=Streptomyces sp. NPDC020983 TaxID=3365106 RepID=UPI0037B6D7C3
MRRRPQPGRRLLPAVVLLGAAASLPAPPAAGAAPSARGPDGGLVTALDSSGSRAGPDGPVRTRIDSARAAIARASQRSADSYRTAGDPVTGGTTAATAAALAPGQYTDTIGPTYSADFANEPVGDGGSLDTPAEPTFVATAVYAPGRLPVKDASDGHGTRPYDGGPASVGLGTVLVSWANRWVDGGDVTPVHSAGDYWITVGLGPEAARLARNAAVGVVLRVNVTGTELSGPQYQAPPVAHGTAAARAGAGDAAPPPAVAAPSGGGGLKGMDLVAAGTGGAAALAGLGAAALIRRLRSRTTRGGA